MQPQEKAIVEKALDVFREKTGIEADFLCEKTGAYLYGDGVVRLVHQNKHREFKAEVKLRVNRATVALLNQKMGEAGNAVLVTGYVNPALAEFMHNQDIHFIDTAGNAFVNAAPLYIFIKDEKPD